MENGIEAVAKMPIDQTLTVLADSGNIEDAPAYLGEFFDKIDAQLNK
jgi:hypothetical protein